VSTTSSQPRSRHASPDARPFEEDAIERLLGSISSLVAERQELRIRDAPAEALERNRREIARLQWDLSRAAIARHSPGAAGLLPHQAA